MAATVYRDDFGVPLTYAYVIATTAFRAALTAGMAGGIVTAFPKIESCFSVLGAAFMNLGFFPTEYTKVMHASNAQILQLRKVSWIVFSGTIGTSYLGSFFFDDQTYAKIGGALGAALGASVATWNREGRPLVSAAGALGGYLIPSILECRKR